MSTTSNVIAGVTLTAALVGGALLIDPVPGTVVQDGGIVDGGQQLIGNFYLRFDSEQAFQQAAKDAGFWRPIMRKEQVCDRWGKQFVEVEDAGFVDMVQVDGGCISYADQLVPADAGEVVPATMDYSFDVIGTITKPILDAGPDAGVQVIEGWHVNFSGILPSDWAQYIVEPENPVRAMR